MDEKFYPYTGATNPAAYEHWNECTDPDYLLEKLMWEIAPIEGKMVLDVGAGSGFQTVRYASKAFRVFAAEPDPRMLRQIYLRLAKNDLANVSVMAASAEEITLPSDSIDVAYARFAYFYGTDESLPGLREIQRILKPGGHFFVIDTNPDQGQFGKMARQIYPEIYTPTYVEERADFYKEHGFERFEVDTVIRAPNRDILGDILKLDFAEHYEEVLPTVEGNEISYSLSVYHFKE